MDYLYFQVQAINGFDSFGHFLRAGLIVNTCSTYATAPTSECQSKFLHQGKRVGAAGKQDPVLARTAAILNGADPADVLSAARRKAIRRRVNRNLARFKAPADTQLMDFLFGGETR